MTCAQSRTYQISCIRISLEPLAILLHVPACNLWKDYFCFYFWVEFPSWSSGLSSSARAWPVWKKPVVCGENDSDGKLQKVQRCRQRCKLIWTSLMWKSEWSLLKKTQLSGKTSGRSEFQLSLKWLESGLFCTVSIFRLPVHREWEVAKEHDGFSMWGQGPLSCSLCFVVINTLRSPAWKQQKSQPT